MGAVRKIVRTPGEVDAELAALGLPLEGLREVLDMARWGRMNSTEYDPPGFSGWSQYALGTRALRELAVDSVGKWTMSNEGNLARTISPDGKMAIVVSSGDDATGDPSRTPRTKNAKGERSLSGFRLNRTQLMLGDLGGQEAPDSPLLWYLLISVRDGEVFGELSLPLDVDEYGRASDWETRIILSGHEESLLGEDDLDDDLEIDVVRKTGSA